jgi:hypothetical protein
VRGPGFQEAPSQFVGAQDASFVGQVRRFGAHGPAYEVIAASAREVDIVVIESGERLPYALAEFLMDPVAETVP